MFYIMKAHHISEAAKVSLKKIIAEERDCTILVGHRERGFNKTVPCYIIGSRGDYGINGGEFDEFTIDTGMGHKGSGKLYVDAVLQVIDGKVTNPPSDVALDSKPAWVMK